MIYFQYFLYTIFNKHDKCDDIRFFPTLSKPRVKENKYFSVKLEKQKIFTATKPNQTGPHFSLVFLFLFFIYLFS